MTDLPPLALSVRQPWAWAIAIGAKTIENRSLGALRSRNMRPGHICLHAAMGLREDENRWAVWRLQHHGLSCPLPMDLIRGAILATVEVTDVITDSDNEWFGGEADLALSNATPLQPIPCPGALGYFSWTSADTTPPVAKWMRDWGVANGDRATAPLFDDLPLSFKSPPRKPFGKGREGSKT